MKNLTIISLFILICASFGCRQKNSNFERQYGDVDIATAKIAVVRGTIFDVRCTEEFPHAELTRVENVSDCAMMVASGECDIAVADGIIVEDVVKNFPELETHRASNKPVPTVLSFNGKLTALRDSFNVFLNMIKDNGLFNEIEQRWKNDIGSAYMPNIAVGTSPDTLIVGIDPQNPAYSFVRGGEYCGIEVELLRRFGEYINRPLRFNQMPFSNLHPAANRGECDVIVSLLTIAPERDGNVLYSESYLDSYTCILTRRKDYKPAPTIDAIPIIESTADIFNIKGEKRTRVAVPWGATEDIVISERHPEAEFVRIDDIQNFTDLLREGNCDAVFAGPVEAIEICNNLTGYEMLLVADVPPSKFAVGFNKDNFGLCDSFNSFLMDLKRNGSLLGMKARWLAKGSKTSMPDIKVPKEGEPLRVATSGLTPVFTFYDGWDLCGFDIELIMRFAQHINRPVEFKIMSFGAILPAVCEGSVDLAINSIRVTPERSKMAMFSDVYFESPTVAIVRKEWLKKLNLE